MATGFDFDLEGLPAIEEPVDVEVQDFKQAVGTFATGVTIVTARRPDGGLLGFTANSFTSVSLRPPLVLLCLDRRAPSLLGFRPGTPFAINVLGADQEALSGQFARHAEDKFVGVGHRIASSGSPLIDGCLANLECRLEHSYYGGDHVILVGRVLGVQVEEGDPLLFFRSRYAHL